MRKNAATYLLDYLNQDPLKHIVHLKVWHTYGPHLHYWYSQSGSDAGVLFLLPTRVTHYESVAYPSTEFVALLTSDAPTVAENLVAQIPNSFRLIFKFTTRHDYTAVATKFSLQPVTKFISYTAPAISSTFYASDDVVISAQFNKRLMSLFTQNGYSAAEILGYFNANQAVSLAIWEQDKPLAACLTYQNYGHVWEIGMLFTVQHARRQGYAQKIVETALHFLLANGRLPRYQMAQTNHPSQALAERIGLLPFLTTVHYLYTPPV